MTTIRRLADHDIRGMIDPGEWPPAIVASDPELPDNPLVYVSEGFTEQTGFRPEEIVGRNCRFLQGPGTDPLAIEAIRVGLRRRLDFSVDLLNYAKDGTPFWNRLRIRPQFDPRGRLSLFIGAQHPIAEREALPVPSLDG